MGRKFQRANLRGKDFRGKDLEGADFRQADIRGADFNNAKLTHANFHQVTAGLSPSSVFNLTSLFFLLSLLAGLCSAYGGAIIDHIITHDADALSLFSFAAVATLVLFLLITLFRGWGTTLTALAEIVAVALLLATLLITVIAFAPENEVGGNIVLGAEFTILGLIGAIAGIVDMAMGIALARILFLPNPKLLAGAIAVLGAIVGALFAVRETGGYVVAAIVTVVNIILGIRIGWQGMVGNKKYWLIRWLTLTMAMAWGTKFNGANLTDADFTQATLNYTDFSNAVLTRTRWQQAKGLDLAQRETANSYETLDLSFRDPINPTTAAIALQELAQKYPDKFELLAIEGAEQQNLRFHAKVTESATQLQLSNELKKIYRQIQLLPDTTRKEILNEKERSLDRLERLLTKAIEKPNYYFDTEGDFSMTQGKGNVNLSGTQGNISGVAAAGENLSMTGVAIGEISGNVTNTINQLPDTPEADEIGIKKLLTQLKQVIEAEPNLSDEDKAEALEVVKTLAEAGQEPEDGKMRKIAKRAIKLLKGTIADLPSTVELVKTCGQLLPLISKFFGF